MIIYQKIEKNLVIPCGLGPSVCPETWYELQGKTVDSSIALQTVEPDSGYYGLYRVIVNPIHDGNLLPGNIKNGVEILGVMGTYAGELMRLQAKTVDASAASVTVTFDPSYDGLSSVTVNAAPLQSKTVDPSTVSQTLTPDSPNYGLGQVTVNPYTLDSKTVDSSTVSQTVTSGADGLSSVTVEPYVLDSKTVNSSTSQQVINSSADGLSSVTVEPYVLDSKTVDSSTVSQTVTSGADGLSSVTVNPYVLDSKTIDPSTSVQVITSDEDGLSSVTVNAALLESRTVDPSTVQIDVQRSSLDYYGLGHVYINPVTSGIDPDIQAGNIKEGVEILGVAGTFQGGPLQAKTANSSTSSQTLTPDNPNYGLSSVTINPYTLETKSDTLTANGQYVYTADNADGLSTVTIDVSIRTALDLQSKTVDSSTSSQNVVADSEYDGLSSVTVNPYTLETKTQNITQNGTYTVTPSNADGLSSVDISVNVADIPAVLQTKSVSYNQNGEYQVEPDQGYEGISHIDISVNVPDIPAVLQSKTVDSSTSSQNVTPDQNYDGLSSVTVNPYVLDSKTVDCSTGQQVITSDADGLSSVTVNAAKLQGRTVTPQRTDNTIYPNASNGYIGFSKVTIYGVTAAIDSDIQPENIKQGIEILGVTGTYEGTIINNQNKTVSSSTSSQTVTADSSYTGLGTVTVNPYTLDAKTVNPSTNSITVNSSADGMSSVTVNAVTASIDPDIQAGNIKKDVEILGVVGTYEGTVINNQNKTVNPSTNSQSITADQGYTGLGTVTVNPYTVETDSSTITQNGTYTFTPQNANALSSVTVDVSVEGGSGDCEEWPHLIGVYNSETPEHAGVVFDSGFPITDQDGMTNQAFEGYFSLGEQSQPSQYFVFGNRSSIDQNTGDRYYWGIWVSSDNELVVSFGAEDEGESAVFTFDEVYYRDLPISWGRLTNDNYGTEDDEYGTEYIYEVIIGDVTRYAPAFDDRLEFFEGVNMCVLGCSDAQQGYEATAPNDTICGYMHAMSMAEVDGEEQERELTLDPYVLNGEATLYSTISQDGEPETEEPLTPVILEGHATIQWSEFEVDTGNVIYVDASTEEQHIATADGNTFTPYVMVNPYTVESNSSVLTANGTYTFTPQGADALSSVTVDVSVGSQVINNQNKTVNSSTSSQTVTADSGYTGLGTVTVNAVTAAIDPDISAGNIRRGVNILGVIGTYDGSSNSNWVVDTKKGVITDLVTDTEGLNEREYGLNSLFRKVNTLNSVTFTNSSANAQAFASVCRYCSNLTSGSFPNLTSTGPAGLDSAFEHCSNLSHVDFPELTTVLPNGFTAGMQFCCTNSSIVDASITFPKLTDVGTAGMMIGFNRSGFSSVSFPALTRVALQGFTQAFGGYTGERCVQDVSFPNLAVCDYDYNPGGSNIMGAFLQAFERNDAITSLSFPSLTTGTDRTFDYAFAGSHLTSISLPLFTSPISPSSIDNCWVVSITAHPLAIGTTWLSDSSYFSYIHGSYITNATDIATVTLTQDASDNISFSGCPLLSAATVLHILEHLDLTVSGKTCTFYSDGLIIEDDAQGSIQNAYDDAIRAGWTINNLTIQPYGSGTDGQFECPDCGGTGEVDGDTCPTCEGTGYVDWDPSQPQFECPDCGGTGEVDGDTCPTCGGSGYVDYDPTA